MQQLGIIPKTCQLTEAWNQVLASGGGSCIPGATNVSVTLGRGSQCMYYYFERFLVSITYILENLDPLEPNGASNLCRSCGNTGPGTCKTPVEASGPYHELYDTYYGGLISDEGLRKLINAIFTSFFRRRGASMFMSSER